MSRSVNKLILIGRLGADPEIREMPEGGRVANFSLATSHSWKDKESGQWQEDTEWHKIVVYNEFAIKDIEKSLKKGSKAYIEGPVKTREWTDRDNIKRYTTELVVSQYEGTVTPLDAPKTAPAPAPTADRPKSQPRTRAPNGPRAA